MNNELVIPQESRISQKVLCKCGRSANVKTGVCSVCKTRQKKYRKGYFDPRIDNKYVSKY